MPKIIPGPLSEKHGEIDQVEKVHVGTRINEAYDFASRPEEWHQEYTKKLLRKIDLRLLHMLSLMFLMSYLDRSNLAQARLAGLEADLGLVGTQFNTCTSILFVGYLVMQLPSNLILTRVKPSIYLPAGMFLWGGISAAQAGVNSYGGLFACRFLLGFAEAPYFPGAVFLMSTWYTRSELSKRYAAFYAGPALANMFGGLIAAGVLNSLEGHAGLRAWRWLYVIESVVTVGLAVIAFFVLPDFPQSTKWLSDEERAYAMWRIANDIGEEEEDTKEPTMMQAVWLAVSDYRTWMFVAMQHCVLLAQTVTFFFPSIVQTLGYDSVTTLLLTCPVWVATFIATMLNAYSASRYKERCLHIVIPMCVTIVGNVMVITVTARGPRFFAMFLMAMGAQCCFMVVLTWISNTFPRPLSKRAAIIAIVNLIGNASNIYGSYLYPSTAAPMYVNAGATVAVLSFVCILLAIVMRFALKHENKKIGAMAVHPEHDYHQDPANAVDRYKGDQQRMVLYQRQFRYMY
ncbi:allantoate permease [Pseudomassariella vexata]|uniref:Allantoate permease n=1 Tax=Pseudomassariella vexata TaxID=1141098 RepID=A0A1Y2DI45_9PEZI|nr:allantoate permease [Pseudomassariella vexata]ORY58890.1 allantoate permease [Pseudomassariella vexata]